MRGLLRSFRDFFLRRRQFFTQLPQLLHLAFVLQTGWQGQHGKESRQDAGGGACNRVFHVKIRRDVTESYSKRICTSCCTGMMAFGTLGLGAVAGAGLAAAGVVAAVAAGWGAAAAGCAAALPGAVSH